MKENRLETVPKEIFSLFLLSPPPFFFFFLLSNEIHKYRGKWKTNVSRQDVRVFVGSVEPLWESRDSRGMLT